MSFWQCFHIENSYIYLDCVAKSQLYHFFLNTVVQSVRYIFNISFLYGTQMTWLFQEVPLRDTQSFLKNYVCIKFHYLYNLISLEMCQGGLLTSMFPWRCHITIWGVKKQTALHTITIYFCLQYSGAATMVE